MASKRLKGPLWIRKITSFLEPKKVYRKNTQLKLGNHHDLKKLFEEINTEYFLGSLFLDINWSGRGETSSRSAIRLGYYNMRTEQIKINKILDYPHIPKYFVSFILYHEILHHLYPPICCYGSRRKIHHPLFKQKEKEFREYSQAQAFLKELKKELFSSKNSARTSA